MTTPRALEKARAWYASHGYADSAYLESLAALLDEARAEALGEAAAVCVSVRALNKPPKGAIDNAWSMGARDGANDCAQRIRALAQRKTEE